MLTCRNAEYVVRCFDESSLTPALPALQPGCASMWRLSSKNSASRGERESVQTHQARCSVSSRGRRSREGSTAKRKNEDAAQERKRRGAAVFEHSFCWTHYSIGTVVPTSLFLLPSRQQVPVGYRGWVASGTDSSPMTCNNTMRRGFPRNRRMNKRMSGRMNKRMSRSGLDSGRHDPFAEIIDEAVITWVLRARWRGRRRAGRRPCGRQGRRDSRLRTPRPGPR